MSRSATIWLALGTFVAGLGIGASVTSWYSQDFFLHSYAVSSSSVATGTVHALRHARAQDQSKVIAALEVILRGELAFLESLPDDKRPDVARKAIDLAKDYRAGVAGRNSK